MKTKTLIVFPRGAISGKDRIALQRAGYIPIEADDPSKIVLPDTTPALATKDLLLAFADGLQSIACHKEKAFDSLVKRLRSHLESPTP